MAHWDVFHSDRLEVERGLTTAAVRAGLAAGAIRDDDLVRPAGTTAPWARLADLPGLPDDAPAAPAREPEAEPSPPGPPAEGEVEVIDDDAGLMALIDEEDDEDDEDDDGPHEWSPAAPAATWPDAPAVPAPDPAAAGDDGPYSPLDLRLPDRVEADDAETSIEVITWDDDLDEGDDPQDEDEAAAEFTLSRGSAETVEELDLAAMVDVAFQLVLFFLVTATTVLYKSLEVPKPNPESRAPEAAQQGRSKSLEDLKDDFILVEIDPAGAVKIDREPVASDVAALAERLRAARERTGRKAMLLSADFATPHKSAVLAYDAANEIGLGIAIARPAPKPTP